MKLSADTGGRAGDGRVLVLLHGMGTTREVWSPLIALLEREWNGRWIAPDLRGHGRSSRADSYALDAHAGDVAETVAAFALDASDVVVLGHSMGGAIALALASGAYGLKPQHVLGLGIKIRWTDEEAAGLATRAAAPAKTFERAEDVAAFYLKVAGLVGLTTADSAMARAGVNEAGTQLAADPRTGLVGPPPMESLIAAANAKVHLAAGERDPMCTLADMKAHDANARVIENAGHNAMVEAPERVFAWLRGCVDA